MIDGSKILTQKRAQNILAENDIDRLYSLYQNYSDEDDYSRIVTLQEIRDKEYNLSPNRYVVYHKEEIRPYAEVLAEFKQAYEDVKRLEKNLHYSLTHNQYGRKSKTIIVIRTTLLRSMNLKVSFGRLPLILRGQMDAQDIKSIFSLCFFSNAFPMFMMNS